MAFGKRDSIRGRPPTAVADPRLPAEFERRIDEALATARASEAAVMRVGVAALDAAEQARRAAELAERASAVMLAERRLSSMLAAEPALLPPEPAAGEIRVTAAERPIVESEDDRLRAFNLRADRVAARLRALGRRPVGVAGPRPSLAT